MAGLVPAIHVFADTDSKDVDARDKPGHDEMFDVIPTRGMLSSSS